MAAVSKMKRILLILAGGALGFFLSWVIVSQRSSETFLREQALWNSEKAKLEAELTAARSQETAAPLNEGKTEIVRVKEEVSPQEIIQRLQKIRILSGAFQTRNTRLAIQQFENLIADGSSALQAIHDFLLRNEEIDYE